MLFSKNDSKSALEAKYEAQRIAFAPIIFQVARCMRDFGILELLHKNEKTGLFFNEILEQINLSEYALKVLLETSLSADIVKLNDEKYRITKIGYFLFNDPMTRVNVDYNHYVNYEALFYLEESLKNRKPIGLQHCFGGDETIYPKLSSLPTKAKESWFAFDHFYSDSAFDEVIKIILTCKPKKILDIGGNTGKFSLAITNKDKNIEVTIADLPQQITLSQSNPLISTSLQINFYPLDILNDNTSLPQGYDAILMSQFLDCFSKEDVIKILQKVKKNLAKNTKIFIVEPLWDKQRFEASAYCIINTSPYFTTMANGYSKMFNYKELAECIIKSGLSITQEYHNTGICQSIIICQ